MYGASTCLDGSGLLGLSVQSLIHGTVVNGNQITSIRPHPSSRLAKEFAPAADGAANTSAAWMSYRLWQRSRWFAPASRVTSVTNARPRCARNAEMSGSSRWNVRSVKPSAFHTTAVSDRIRLLSDP